MGRVIVLGSLNADLVTSVDRHPRPGETVLGEGLVCRAGGKGANQAVAAAAAGADVEMVGCVGQDAHGTAYRQRLEGLGIGTAHLTPVADVPTGTALIAVDEAGENTIVVVPGANDHASPGALDEIGLRPGDVLLMQLEIGRRAVCTAARSAHAAGARVVLNLAPFASLPQDVVALADPVVVNEHEMSQLAEAGLVPTSTLVTFGAHGVRWDAQEWPAVTVPPGQVVDTTGAGDAFCGALAAALAGGADREAAVQAALRAGAEAVTYEGAQRGGLL